MHERKSRDIKVMLISYVKLRYINRGGEIDIKNYTLILLDYKQ